MVPWEEGGEGGGKKKQKQEEEEEEETTHHDNLLQFDTATTREGGREGGKERQLQGKKGKKGSRFRPSQRLERHLSGQKAVGKKEGRSRSKTFVPS